MVLIFGNSVLKATFSSAKHGVLGTGLAWLQEVKERKSERERERERVIVSGCAKISLPCPCLFVFLSVSHTVSTALHIFDPLPCLFGQH